MKRRQGYSGKQPASASKITTLDWAKLANVYDQLIKEQIEDRWAENGFWMNCVKGGPLPSNMGEVKRG